MEVLGIQSDGPLQVVRAVEYRANFTDLFSAIMFCTRTIDRQLVEHVVDKFRIHTNIHKLYIPRFY